jgi:hypothetical protein
MNIDDYQQIESSQRQHDQYMKHNEEMVTLGEERILKFIATLVDFVNNLTGVRKQ